MKLFRIRRKSDGHFFMAFDRYDVGVALWGPSGCFFKKIDTIAQHLEWLSCDHDLPCGDKWPWPARRKKRNVVIIKRHPSRLKLYEVVINDVTINGEEIIPAHDLMKKRKTP